jgi:hypothetical protein
MIMGMQSVFVVGGEDLPTLPDVYANVYLDGGNFTSWNASEVDSIEKIMETSYWRIHD